MNKYDNRFFKILKNLLRITSVCAVVCCVMFIFYNSSRNADISGNMSNAVTDAVNHALQTLSFDFSFSDKIIRKLAHLTEFAALGFFFTLSLRVFTARLAAFSAWPLLFGLFIAVCDEFLQNFVPGRSAQVSDIIIDFAGVCAGTATAMIIVCIISFIIWFVYRRKRPEHSVAENSI